MGRGNPIAFRISEEIAEGCRLSVMATRTDGHEHGTPGWLEPWCILQSCDGWRAYGHDTLHIVKSTLIIYILYTGLYRQQVPVEQKEQFYFNLQLSNEMHELHECISTVCFHFEQLETCRSVIIRACFNITTAINRFWKHC